MREIQGYHVNAVGVFSPKIRGDPFHGIEGYTVASPPDWVMEGLTFERMCDEILQANPKMRAEFASGKELDAYIMSATRGETWPYYEPFYAALESLHGLIRVTYDPTPTGDGWSTSDQAQVIWLRKNGHGDG